MRESYLNSNMMNNIINFIDKISNYDIIDGVFIIPWYDSMYMEHYSVYAVYVEKMYNNEGYLGPESKEHNAIDLKYINKIVYEYNEKNKNDTTKKIEFSITEYPNIMLMHKRDNVLVRDFSNGIVLYDKKGNLNKYKLHYSELLCSEVYNNLLDTTIINQDGNNKKLSEYKYIKKRKK